MANTTDMSGRMVGGLALVLGGTAAGLTLAFPGETLRRTLARLQRAFASDGEERVRLAEEAMQLSEKARREGLLSLEDEAIAATHRLMQAGLMGVVDGAPPKAIEAILGAAAATERTLDRQVEHVCEHGARLAVGLGLAGTLLALSEAIADEGGLRRAAGQALIPAACGLLSAALFWRPMAERLAARNESAAGANEQAVSAILAIQQLEPPALVRARMEAPLGPDERAKLGTALQRLRESQVKPRPRLRQKPEETTENPALRGTDPEDIDAFRLKDFVRIRPVDRKRVVRELDSNLIKLALRGTDEDVQAAFFASMPEHAARDLHEQFHHGGPQRLSLVREAQAYVEEMVRRLARENEIWVPKRAADTAPQQQETP